MMKKLLISALLLILPSVVAAAEVDLAEVVKTLETPFKSETPASERITDFSAGFSQQSHIASINRVQHGGGRVQFRFLPGEGEATAQFRWDYTKPDVQEIISDGSTMWVYLPDNKQVIESDISRLSAEQGENPVTFLSGLGDLSQDFSIAWGAEKLDRDGNPVLRLRPRKSSQLLESIAVVVNREAVDLWLKSHKTGEMFPILTTMVTDLQGNRTTITFEDVVVNGGLGAEPFSFVRPDEVELVKPEQMSF